MGRSNAIRHGLWLVDLLNVTLETGLTRTIVERMKLHVQKRMNCLSKELWKGERAAQFIVHGSPRIT